VIELRLPQQGDAFVLGAGFGVVQAANPLRGVALVSMQSGVTGEIPLGLAVAAVDALRHQEQEAS